MKFSLGVFSFIFFLGITLGVGALPQSFQIASFTATYQGVDIRLEWKIENGNEVNRFEILRKRPDDASFSLMTRRSADGSTFYSLVDDNLYKTGEEDQIQYKLKAYGDHIVREKMAELETTPTAVQRSWGSIKAMFK